MGDINVRLSYPRSDKYEYRTQLKRYHLDKEKDNSILSGNGFLVTQCQSTLKKDMKAPFGIFSHKFGTTLQDLNPFMDKCKCTCGFTTGMINLNTICPKCGDPVVEVEENFNYFGWLVLDESYTIHPNLFKCLQSYIGKTRFDNIIKPINEKDENGHTIATVIPKGEPFFGIGIMELSRRIEEVLKYYYKPNIKTQEKYNQLLNNIDKIFTHSIPVCL